MLPSRVQSSVFCSEGERKCRTYSENDRFPLPMPHDGVGGVEVVGRLTSPRFAAGATQEFEVSSSSSFVSAVSAIRPYPRCGDSSTG